MDRETVKQYVLEYENDKQNKGFCTILLNSGKRVGQTPTNKRRLRRFELSGENNLLIQIGDDTQIISIQDIDSISLRSKFI